MALINEAGNNQFVLAVTVLEHAVHILLQSYLHRRAVDAIEACVVVCIALSRIGMLDIQRRIAQVEGRHTGLNIQQRCVALGRRLGHFVLNREEVYGIFAGHAIRTDDNTFLLEDSGRMAADIIYRIDDGVLR